MAELPVSNKHLIVFAIGWYMYVTDVIHACTSNFAISLQFWAITNVGGCRTDAFNKWCCEDTKRSLSIERFVSIHLEC